MGKLPNLACEIQLKFAKYDPVLLWTIPIQRGEVRRFH